MTFGNIPPLFTSYPYGPRPSSGVASSLFVDLFNPQTVAGVKTFTDLPVFKNGVNTVLEMLPLNAGANMALSWATQGIGAPTTTTRTPGTRLVLYGSLDAFQTDYAIGIGSSAMWFSVADPGPVNAFRWYGGVNQAAALYGNGLFDATGTVRATGTTAPASGTGVELTYSASNGYVVSYNRTGAAYTALNLEGLSVRLNPSGIAALTASSSGVDVVNDLTVITAGKGLKIKEGSNAKMGSATLVAGAATVSTTAVTASSRIFLTSNTDGGTPGWLRVSARNAAQDFTITSSSGTDASTVAWVIFEPAP